MTRPVLLFVVALALLTGCDKKQPPEPPDTDHTATDTEKDATKTDSKGALANPIAPRLLAPPAAPDAMAPSLYPRPDGVGLSWLEPNPERSKTNPEALRMRHATFADGRWSKPQTVVDGVEFFANWADVPTVVRTSDGTLFAHWPQKSDGGTYAYDVVVARSDDGGETWTTLGTPHRDETATEHGFATMIPEGEGAQVVWLDGRKTADDPPGAMTLRTTVARKAFAKSSVLDERVCDCCATDAIATDNGAIVAYRNRDEAEVRDIAVKRRVDGEWQESKLVHRDDWTIPGCPVNGPAIAALGTTVAVAWFTGTGQRARVRVAFSTDSGESFGEPLELDAQTGDDAPLGRVDVAHLGADEFGISWLDGQGDDAVIRLQRVSVSGEVGKAVTIAKTQRSRAAGVPRIERFDDRLIAVWTVPGEPSSLLASSIAIGEIPPADRRGEAPSAKDEGPQEGWELPLFYATSLDGERRRLKSGGRTLVVNLWATWCEPCRKEMPILDDLQRERSDDVRFVAVSVDAADSEQAVRRWAKEHEPEIEILLDPGNQASRVFGVDALPATFVFDPEGRLIWFERGAVARDELASALADRRK